MSRTRRVEYFEHVALPAPGDGEEALGQFHLAGVLGESATKSVRTEPVAARSEESSPALAFPPGATMCHKCNTNAVIMMDGCATCLNCGYSKCG